MLCKKEAKKLSRKKCGGKMIDKCEELRRKVVLGTVSSDTVYFIYSIETNTYDIYGKIAKISIP